MSFPGLGPAPSAPQEQSQFLSVYSQYLPSPQPFVPQLEKLPELFKVPSDATSCLYIDGIPIDAKEREVARSSS